jgi:hypothetical protein
MTPMSETKCPTILLSDDPAKEDRFGSHRRVAEALVELVQSESGGRSIALLGSWGSGKSSVVSIASIIASGRVEFFVFDAWAHQGDPLRRVFIEKAIQYFQKKGWIKNPSKWANEKEKLAGRLEERRSTTRRKPTPAGIVVVLASLGLVAAFQQFSMEKLFGSGPAYRADVYALIAMVTSGLLIAWTVGASRGDMWGALLDKEGGTTISKTSRNVDPTSVEFQDLFGALLDECLSDRTEPFVIAIDNLDRVPQSDALSVWATLRAFSELQSFANHGWRERAWILVPFAPEILKTWALAQSSTEAGSAERSFLAKNFQVIFRVPQPVLSDWQDYVLQYLKIALPRHNDTDLQEVVRIMQLPKFNPNLNNLATPREIKLFVNQLGAVHRQWGDQVPLQMQALFLMLADTAESLEVHLRRASEAELGNVPPGLIGADWREWVAALHYNIPKERALHVLLSDKVLNALQLGDPDYFESQSSLPGLLRVLWDVISYRVSDWSRDSPATVALASRSIRALDDTEPLVGRCREVLCDALASAAKWPAPNAEVAEGLVAMMEWRDSKDFATTVISVLARATSGVSAPPDAGQMKVWADALFSIANHVKFAHPDLIATIKIPSSDVTAYFGVAGSLIASGYSEKIPQLLSPTDPAGVLNQLVGIAGNFAFRQGEAEILKILMREHPTLEFGNLAGTLSVALRANNNPQPDVRLAVLLTLLRMSATLVPAQDVLRSSVSEGNFGKGLAQFLEAKDERGQEGVAASFIAMLIYKYSALGSLEVQPGVAYFDQKLRQADDSDLISRICKLAESLGLSGQMRRIHRPPGSSEYEKFYLLVRQSLGDEG